MTSKLALYNGALRDLGERKLASLTEAREPRRVLDDYYDEALKFCLEAGLWNFAIRTVKIEANTDITPEFGFAYVFDKPEDWVRTAALSADEKFSAPLLDYQDESAYWFADVDTIYVRYVSNDTSFGMDLGIWPSRFARFAELYLASLGCERITQSSTKADRIEKKLKKAKLEAKSVDAMNDASPQFPPTGRLVRSRSSGFGNRDLGRRNNLTG